MKHSPAGKRTATAWSGVLAFVAVTLGVSLLLVVGRRPPLTPEQAMVHAGRLAALAARTRVEAPGSDAAVTVTYTFDGRCGDVAGLVVLNQWTRDGRAAPPETQLRFSLAVRHGRRARGPGEPAAAELRLVRDDAASDLLPAPAAPAAGPEPTGGGEAAATTGDGGSWRPAAVSVSILPPGGLPPPVLAIDNLDGAGARAAAQARFPDPGLPAPADCLLTARDLEVLDLLARGLRARICEQPDIPGSRCYDTVLTLYRAAPGGRYWIEVRALATSTGERPAGMAAYLLDVVENRGRLWSGQLRVIRQRTDLGVPADLFFVHPRPPGTLLTPADPGGGAAPYRPPPGRPHAPVPIDFQALLGDTGWLGDG